MLGAWSWKISDDKTTIERKQGNVSVDHNKIKVWQAVGCRVYCYCSSLWNRGGPQSTSCKSQTFRRPTDRTGVRWNATVWSLLRVGGMQGQYWNTMKWPFLFGLACWWFYWCSTVYTSIEFPLHLGLTPPLRRGLLMVLEFWLNSPWSMIWPKP